MVDQVPSGADGKPSAATVYRDPTEDDRVWVLFDWGEAGWKSFASGPRGPADHAGSRPQEQATGGGARRQVRRLAVLPRDVVHSADWSSPRVCHVRSMIVVVVQPVIQLLRP